MYLDSKKKQLIVDMLKKEIPKLQALYIFGSQNDGTATQKSDIDIAYFGKKTLASVERWDLS